MTKTSKITEYVVLGFFILITSFILYKLIYNLYGLIFIWGDRYGKYTVPGFFLSVFGTSILTFYLLSTTIGLLKKKIFGILFGLSSIIAFMLYCILSLTSELIDGTRLTPFDFLTFIGLLAFCIFVIYVLKNKYVLIAKWNYQKLLILVLLSGILTTVFWMRL